jgi:hypothetical protein
MRPRLGFAARSGCCWPVHSPLRDDAAGGAASIPPAGRDWRVVATRNDRERLRDWRNRLHQGARQARAAGHAAEIAREGALLDPDAALGGGPIPNGDYRCRVIKLGAKSPGMLDYVAYPAFACRVAQERSCRASPS